MNIIEVGYKLKNGRKDERINLLSHLSDVFEAKVSIENLDELINLLIKSAVDETENEVKEELFDTLLIAATYRNISSINLDLIEEHLLSLPIQCLALGIEVLAASHNKKYSSVIQQLKNHHDTKIASIAEIAFIEIGGGDNKLT